MQTTGGWGLADWQRHLRDLYARQNRRRSIDWMWCRMSEEVSELLRPVRRSSLEVINNQLPDLFAWCCPFADLEGWLDLDDVLWERYSRGCPACGKFPCSGCGAMPHAEDVTSQVRRPLDPQRSFFEAKRPKSVDDWQDYFGELYRTQNSEREPSYFVDNLVQDIGKVSKYVRLNEHDQVKAGLASIIAWLFALCNGFSSSEPEGKYRLSRLLAAKYDTVCPKCRKSPCGCRARVSSLFISWSDEVSAERDRVESVVKEMGFTPVVFRDLGPDMDRGRMFAAFEAINRCDGAIVLLAPRFSPRVYGELLEATFRLSHEMVLIYVKRETKSGAVSDSETDKLLSDLRTRHQVPSFSELRQLDAELRRDLAKISSGA